MWLCLRKYCDIKCYSLVMSFTLILFVVNLLITHSTSSWNPVRFQDPASCLNVCSFSLFTMDYDPEPNRATETF